MEEGKLRLIKMNAELSLKECEDSPWQPKAKDIEGMKETQIEVLTLQKQVDKLSKALAQGGADGVGADATLLANSNKALVQLEKRLKKAQEAEEARIKEAEEIKLKATKRKKKKGKKRG